PLLYPALPGRLTAINGQPVNESANKDERALNRDLSLSWSAELPPGNRLLAGDWWPSAASGPRKPGNPDLPGVSVEAELAKKLQIKLGDRLSFSLGAAQRDAQVRSLRELHWDSLQPNFYMVFEPGALQDLPVTYLTSFYLPPQQERQLIELARAFPAVTLLQVDVLLAQLRSILAQVTLAVEWVLLFVLAAGLSVLFAGLQSTLDERTRQSALLRALGAERRLLNQARLREFALLGATSGLIAALGCELVSALLYNLVFKISWHPHPWLLVLPLLGAVLVASAGLLGTRRALNASPLTVLREG
ncbi:MAG: ABC transporter permease, partial [Pseudomonas sp.]|nr:ABC transporter permease [Pseudomonas sp.]